MKKKYGYRICIMFLIITGVIFLGGCGNSDGKEASEKNESAAEQAEGNEDASENTLEAADENQENEAAKDNESQSANAENIGIANESAADGHVDFEALQKENPDIFAWIYIPGTGIDAPVLQSAVSDDFYKSHTQEGTEGEEGALYTEMPNMMNMCDFNTIIHGKDKKETDLFYELHLFEDPDFFEEHSQLYLYLPDNVLTYCIFAAYYDESSDILRRYDYTTIEGCQGYLNQLYSTREMTMNFREDWEGLTPGHFLLTLDGEINTKTDKQYVVIGALVKDPVGTIDRVFYTE